MGCPWGRVTLISCIGIGLTAFETARPSGLARERPVSSDLCPGALRKAVERTEYTSGRRPGGYRKAKSGGWHPHGMEVPQPLTRMEALFRRGEPGRGAFLS